jgi:hypothetical protein
MTVKKKWKRKCPECGEEIPYSRIYERDRAEKQNTNCRLCVMGSEEVRKKISEFRKGKPGHWKGKVRSEEVRKNMSNSHKGIIFTDEHRKNISKSHKGHIPWNKGKIDVYSEETLKRMRLF